MRRLIVFLMMMWSWPAMADVGPAVQLLANGAMQATLCAAEADVGACKNVAGTHTIVVDTGGRSLITFYSTQSTATTYTCDAYTNDTGYSATARASLTSAGAGTQLTPTTMSVSVSGALRFVWVECSTAISGGGALVTITAVIGGGQ